jgi:hypothetical protein
MTPFVDSFSNLYDSNADMMINLFAGVHMFVNIEDDDLTTEHFVQGIG